MMTRIVADSLRWPSQQPSAKKSDIPRRELVYTVQNLPLKKELHLLRGTNNVVS